MLIQSDLLPFCAVRRRAKSSIQLVRQSSILIIASVRVPDDIRGIFDRVRAPHTLRITLTCVCVCAYIYAGVFPRRLSAMKI